MADFRGTSVDFKRDNSTKAKWARGEAYGPGRAKDGHAAPARSKAKFPRTNQELRLDRNTKTAGRLDIRDEATHNHNSDSSDLESPVEPNAPTALPVEDADITYSFDAERGPSHGSTVLSSALAKAVERFESNATEKLVKDEYDVLPLNPEEVHTPMKKGKARMLTTDEEDDYEFV